MIGDNIKRMRQQKNMTQGELAEAIHVKRQTVSSWEVNRTEPNIGIVELIASALGCQKSDIIGRDIDPQQETPVYYLNPETARIAQEVFDSPETRILFDAARDARPQDILLAAEMLKRMKETNPDG